MFLFVFSLSFGSDSLVVFSLSVSSGSSPEHITYEWQILTKILTWGRADVYVTDLAVVTVYHTFSSFCCPFES